MKELFIYYDPEYDPDCTRKFISQSISERIVEFLKSKEFQVLKAQELRDVMLAVVKQEKENVVVVFAQDVAPDTVLDDPTATALVRQYLDNGGSIIWVGDIPFWNQAKRDGKGRNDDWWRNGAPFNILGVNPIFPTEMCKAKLTREGIRKGLRVTWTGIRPVLPNKGVNVLAKAKSSISRAYQIVPANWWSRQLDRFRGFTIGAGSVNVGLELKDFDQKLEISFLWNKELANAWFKNFCLENPSSGFYRIWDYSLIVLTNQQLDDIYNLAIFCTK